MLVLSSNSIDFVNHLFLKKRVRYKLNDFSHAHVVLGKTTWANPNAIKIAKECEKRYQKNAIKLDFNKTNKAEDYKKLVDSEIVIVHSGDPKLILDDIERHKLGEYFRRAQCLVLLGQACSIASKRVTWIQGDTKHISMSEITRKGLNTTKYRVISDLNKKQTSRKDFNNECLDVINKKTHDTFLILSDSSFIVIDGKDEYYKGTIYKIHKNNFWINNSEISMVSTNNIFVG